jgi:hypothetical protein
MTKLTLIMDEAVVEQAKRMARARRTSVSAIFSQFIESAALAAVPTKIGPLTRKLSGVMALPPRKGYKQLLAEALVEKYGIAK